jgi:solute carrier family 35 protein E1
MWVVKINPVKLFGLQLPTKQNVPKTTKGDLAKTVPVGFCSAAAHACTVFALGGDPLFGQIVKSGEPVLSALVNTVFYGTPPSNAKIGCLPIIVGGVAFASLKKDAITGGYALKFDQTALVFGMMANTFAAFKGSENKKLMSDKSIAERFAGVGNQVSRVESTRVKEGYRVRVSISQHYVPLFTSPFYKRPRSSPSPKSLPSSCACLSCF